MDLYGVLTESGLNFRDKQQPILLKLKRSVPLCRLAAMVSKAMKLKQKKEEMKQLEDY